MNISLTPAFEKIIEKKVKSGLYHSSSEVVREALRLMIEFEGSKEKRLDALRSDIHIGLKQADRGELVTFDIAEIESEGKKLFKKISNQ